MCTAQGLVNTCPWETSPLRKGKDISIDGNKVTKTAQSWASGTAIVSDGVILKHGSSVKQRWSFTIQNGTQQTIGVVTSAYDARSDEYVNKTTKGWGFYQPNGNTGHGGPATTSYASEFYAGDTVDGAWAHFLMFECGTTWFSFIPDTMPHAVGLVSFATNPVFSTVQVCSATCEMRFFVNGADRGVAYRNLPVGTPLYAAVSLYGKDAQTVYNVRSTSAECAHTCVHKLTFFERAHEMHTFTCRRACQPQQHPPHKAPSVDRSGSV